MSQERWLVSYADFITLLFAFFTTLYAISNVDLQKMNRLVSSLHVAFETRPPEGVSGKVVAAQTTAQLPVPPRAAIPKLATLPPRVVAQIGRDYLETTLSGVREQLGRALAPALKDGRVSIEVDPRGLVVSIRESGTFRTGSADLTPATRELVAEIGAALRNVENFVRVEGHTDDVPIHSPRFASNWELSTARATAVVAFLVQAVEVPPNRLSAAGYAEFHPRAPNTSDENRRRNRRVDIVILNQTTALAEEPAEAVNGRRGAEGPTPLERVP